MALRAFVGEIAKFLAAEAKLRIGRNLQELAVPVLMRPQLALKKVAKADPYSCDVAIRFDSLTLYFRQMVWNEKRGWKTEKALFSVVVFFGPTPRETRATSGEARKKMREPFRPTGNLSHYKAMCLDEDTFVSILEEQLTVFLSQSGISDDSIESLFYQKLTENNGKKRTSDRETLKRYVFSQLVARFTDPEDPRSYAAFKRYLRQEGRIALGFRRRVVPLPSTRSEITDDSDDSDPTEEKTAREETEVDLRTPDVEKGESILRSRRRSEEGRPYYYVNEVVARYPELTRRTFYYWKKTGALPPASDGNGVMIIDQAHIGQLESLIERVKRKQEEADIRRLLIDYYAEIRGILRDSAKRRLGRKIEVHGSLKSVAQSEPGLEAWLKLRTAESE